MVVSQRQPHLFFKPIQFFGKTIGAAGQPTILLSLCQVIALNKTRVNRATDRGLGPSCRDLDGVTQHDLGVNRRDAALGAMLNHLRIQQVSARSLSRFWITTARPAARRTVPFAVDIQQGLSIGRPLIARKKRDRFIGDPRDLLEPPIGIGLIMLADDEPQDETPNGRKS